MSFRPDGDYEMKGKDFATKLGSAVYCVRSSVVKSWDWM